MACFVTALHKTGTYAALKPDNYTIKNIQVYGQLYTQKYGPGSFRRPVEIRGGAFGNFVRGAPYATIDGLTIQEGSWDNGYFNGAFAGNFINFQTFQSNQCGARMGFWDLNGQNWHSEGNGCAGFVSTMPGGSVNTVRSSFNGASAYAYIAGNSWPMQHGCNWLELGTGNTITNLRMQESWGDSLVICSVDPLGIGNNGGARNSFYLGTFDDTGDILPAQHKGATPLLGVRAMIRLSGNTVVGNSIDLVNGSGQVFAGHNYATNGYYDDGNPSGNSVTLRTPGITNDLASWYAGGGATAGDTAATLRGPWATASSSSIATRGNTVIVNGQAAA